MTKETKDLIPSGSDFLLYSAPGGAVTVRVLFKDETAWLTQKGLAELFGVKVPAVAKHLKNIFDSGELEEATLEWFGALGYQVAHGPTITPGEPPVADTRHLVAGVPGAEGT